ncbi:MAG: response regulator [Treponema sp.]|nr:response regulator [Treponema sp.]
MKILPSRLLYIQVLFTMAFTAMVFLSYLFTRDIVHSNLVRNAEGVFSFAQKQLESDLFEPRAMLSGFSQTVRNMIMRGDNSDAVIDYMHDMTNYFRAGGSRIMSSVTIFGHFDAFPNQTSEGRFLFLSSGETFPEGYYAPDRPWYKLAEGNCGHVIETPPYESILSGKTVITYARCIHDHNDVRLGIVGMEVSIGDIGMNVINTAADSGGYSIVISQEHSVIFHSNPEFNGMSVTENSMPISAFIDNMRSGEGVVEGSMVNWKGEACVVFMQQLSNGWHLALIMPEGPFYRSIKNMAITLILLGFIFAAALIVILTRIDAARNKSDLESKHKSAFLANMSHEIRTPMNAIIGMTTIGKTSSDIARKDLCFRKIEDASNHLLGVINDILDMSKIEANKFDLSPSEFNFEKTLQRIVNVVNFRIDEKFQKFSVHIDRKIPHNLIGDDQRLTQVITNLLSNAIKFTPERGSIQLDTHFVEEIDNICTIQVSVTDNGIGMNYEQQKRVFSSFEQAETSTTRKYGGTGLGLPISKNIVELMGGTLWMVSEIDKGSTFSFTVKLKRGESKHLGLLSPDINLDNVRVMVVDDDMNILDYFKEISKEFNLICDTASSGEEAIKLVEQNGHYHIYFIDWKMPGMDGIQLTSELKAHHEPAKSVVIMITAAEWASVETEARGAGVDKFLSKPLFPSCIANAINEALGIDYHKIEETHKEKNVAGVFSGKHVLIVEDVEINREIVMTLLEPTGVFLDCAENGQEALRIFSETPEKYDLILMDVQMPIMDGYESASRIRALNVPQAKTIPIVAMTANVFREDIERCLEAGMNNHIGKPLDYNEMFDKLMIYLPKSKEQP